MRAPAMGWLSLAWAIGLAGCGDDRSRPADVDAAVADAAADGAADTAVADVAVPDAAVADVAVADVAVPDAAPNVDADLIDANTADATAPRPPPWTVRGPISTSVDSVANAIAWDSSGALWLAGTDSTSALETAGWVRRLDLAGTEQWVHRVDVVGDDDSFRGIAADGSGNAVAVGKSGPNLIRKFDAAGTVLWTTPDTASLLGRRNEDVLAGGGGTWVIAGATRGLEFAGLLRYDAGGTLVASNFFGTTFCDHSIGRRLARSATGEYFFGGPTCSSEFGAPTFLRRTTSSLTTVYDRFDTMVAEVEGVAFAGTGGELLVCTPTSLNRYTDSGVIIRRTPLTGACKRIAITPTGLTVLAEAMPDGSARISTLDGADTVQTMQSYRGAANLGASPSDLDIASDGTIYVTGSENTAGKPIYYVQALAP